MAKFILAKDDKEYALGDQNTLGRLPSSSITLNDEQASARHALLRWEQGSWLLQDLGSSNGTFVNGHRIDKQVLKDGDQVQLGTTHLTFSIQDVERTQSAVKVQQSEAPVIHCRLDGKGHEDFLPAADISDMEQLKRDYEKLRIANELNQAIGLEPNIDLLLGNILDEVFKVLPADRGVIMLMDPLTNSLDARATKQRGESTEEILLSSTIIEEVFGSGAAVLSSDASIDARFSSAHSVMSTGMRSIMCVPMIYRSQLYGIVHLDSLLAQGVFSDKDLQILTGLAAQAGRAIDNSYKAKKIEQSALARREFERLLPPEIVEQVVSGNVNLKRGGEMRETTILFSDIRGFTQWTESNQPEHIVRILNDYFEIMVDAIHKHHGTLDKFMGDGIMALFGAPIAHENDVLNALHTAMDMLEGLEELNIKLALEGQPAVEIGIGINHGPVIAGYMGSSKSMEYTAIGDHVNLAARLCGVAEPGQILLSENTYKEVSASIRTKALPPVILKGKREPQKIYQVLGQRFTATIDAPLGDFDQWDDDTGIVKIPPKMDA